VSNRKPGTENIHLVPGLRADVQLLPDLHLLKQIPRVSVIVMCKELRQEVLLIEGIILNAYTP
jgi:hypothetical protein